MVAILVLRTWAIWNRSKSVFWLLIAMGCVKIPLVILALYHMIHDAHCKSALIFLRTATSYERLQISESLLQK